MHTSSVLCMFYAKMLVFDALSAEKLRERVENLSQPRQNLSLSFSNLSVRLLFPTLNALLQNVKIILHRCLTKEATHRAYRNEVRGALNGVP